MDPDVNLARQLDLAAAIHDHLDGLDASQWPDEQARSEHFEHVAELGNELATHVRALDGWLSTGGFGPANWQAPDIDGSPVVEIDIDVDGIAGEVLDELATKLEEALMDSIGEPGAWAAESWQRIRDDLEPLRADIVRQLRPSIKAEIRRQRDG